MSWSTFVRLIVALVLIWVVLTLVDAAYTGWQEAHPPLLGAPSPLPTPKVDVSCHSSWPPTDSPWLSVAQADAQKYQIDALTFAWKIWDESGFNPDVHPSSAGAIGIAQFMPATAQGMGIDPTDPTQALDASARLDAGHIQTYTGRAELLAGHYGGSSARYAYALALAAYDAGPGAVQSAWNRAFAGAWPASPWTWLAEMAGETQRYVPDVLGCALS